MSELPAPESWSVTQQAGGFSVVIENDVPLPERRWKPKGSRRTHGLPFDKMRVGDSIFVPGITSRAIAAASDWNRLNKPKRLETRSFDRDEKHKTHGVRVWRTR